MNTVKSLLQPRVVSEPGAIHALRCFQHQRYCDAGLLKKQRDMRLPHDPLVAHSTYFGVYDDHSIVATARIVGADRALSMLAHYTLDPYFADLLEASRGRVGEISRLAVGRQAPRFETLALLAREFLRFGLDNPGASLLIASVDTALVRILGKVLGVPLKVIGAETASYGGFEGACVPILIDTNECLRTFTAGESRHAEFFAEDLIIDLTGLARAAEQELTV